VASERVEYFRLDEFERIVEASRQQIDQDERLG
jgi:hypothetical protein